MLGQNEQLQVYQERFRYLYLAVILIGLLLGFRLWYLQVLQGDNFKRIAEENRLKKVIDPAPRGMVFDRNRKLLLDNQPTFSLVITPQYFQTGTESEQKTAIKKLAKITKISSKAIWKALNKAWRQPSFQPVLIKKNLSEDEVALVEMEKIDLRGVDVDVGIQRTNVFGEISAHILGYISKISPKELPKLNQRGRRYAKDDSVGKAGLEQQWEDDLRGVDGVSYLEVDALGLKKREVGQNSQSLLSDLTNRKPVPGKNFVLTIDQDLQNAAAKAFAEEKKTGAIVAIDPNNGEVLAMISWPSFKTTDFSIGVEPTYLHSLFKNENKPLLDKTIKEHYGPGSTFKIISAIAALEEGVIEPYTKVQCGGSFRFGRRNYHDWKRSGFGSTDVVKSLAQSVDVYYYKLAVKMDIDTLAAYAKRLGLGQKTNVRLPGEISGIVPNRDWKLRVKKEKWQKGETLSVIIGQSFLTATPIQLANMIAAIANGGILYRPRIVKQIETPNGEILETTQPEIISENKFQESTLRYIREGLKNAFSHKANGTAKKASIPGIDAAGKTGTTQVVRFTKETLHRDCKKQEKRFRHHGLFVAYAPLQNPKIAVAVVAEHSCSGSVGAAPIAMQVIKTYLGKIDPDKYGEPALAKARKKKFWKTNIIKPEQELEQEESVPESPKLEEDQAASPSDPDNPSALDDLEIGIIPIGGSDA